MTIRPQFSTKETKDIAVPNILNNVKVSVPNIYANKKKTWRDSGSATVERVLRWSNCIMLKLTKLHDLTTNLLFHSNQITWKCNRSEIVYYSFHHESHFHEYHDNFILGDKSMKF